MAIRNRWKVGDYLMQDDESGFTRYASEMVERWDGLMFQRKGNEDEIRQHPQLFVRAFNDPQAERNIRPVSPSSAVLTLDPQLVKVSGGPTVKLPKGAAQHLFPSEAGIETGFTIASSAKAEVSARSFIIRD